MATERLAKFVEETKFEDLSPELIKKAKNCILDGIGVMLLGSQERAGKIAAEHVKEMGAKGQSEVYGYGFKTAAPLAAFANGIMTHALDYDDWSEGWVGHPTAVLLPAVLAMGEAKKASGKKVLEAYIIGWEVGARINNGSHRKAIERGLHPTAWLGALATAAVAGKIMGLPAQKIRAAFGTAASGASGLVVNFGSDTKPFHAGNAARGGITAAMLAEKGFTSSPTILEEDKTGLCSVLSQMACDEEAITRNLGSEWDLISPGEMIKPYPSCGATHTMITAMLELVHANEIRPDDVEEIVMETPPFHEEILMHHSPQTGLQAKWSLEYLLAAAILDKEIRVIQLTDAMVLRPEAQKLMKRVRYVHPPGAPAGQAGIFAPQRLIVKLKNGKVLTREQSRPKGHSSNPVTLEELVGKFTDCTRHYYSPESIKQIVAKVQGLEKLNDFSELCQLAGRRSAKAK